MRISMGLIFAVLLFTGCTNNQLPGDFMLGKKMELDTSLSSPKGYPIDIVQGYNAYRDENGNLMGGFFAPRVKGGWDDPEGTAMGRMDRLPHRVHLLWFSLAENQFYELDAELPVERMKELYKEGFRLVSYDRVNDRPVGEYDTYSGIGFMLAPGGGVVAKMLAREAREIGYFKAKKIDMPWHIFQNVTPDRIESGDREKFVASGLSEERIGKEARDEILGHKIPFGLWDEVYRRTYPWSMHIVHPLALEKYYIEFVNTERYMVWEYQVTKEHNRVGTPVPAFFGVYFITPEGKRMVGLVKFDLRKTTKLFEEYFKNISERANLDVKVSDDLKSVEVKLVNSQKSVVVPHRIWKVNELYKDNWGFDTMDW
ncbi:DUF2931 family protein [Sulfuricurvum sp.]|uniref:DUF2931 family protein n=1 Tax=Sulfuricurvum sp. TaxID=2025608 RepID=UPI0026079E3B|nr:DUF2931 family protein [Sulfuricurvum sp.]MDD2782338.1 DUF2931 family protein [Sulfuricurvum sp.]